MFVDRVQIDLHAGKGGDGCSSMRREKYVPRGGPDGGDGGHGGSLILEAKLGVNSLAAYANRRFYHAPKGQPGQGSMRHGRRGNDQTLYVPPGTTVIDAEQGFVIKDLTLHGDSFVVARGGRGGKGNAHYKSATNQAPREFTRGEEGEARSVILELKSIADVGLVGKPNAGKSTLLSRITAARPEIADYPFTTKHPNLGIVELDEVRSFVLADIPGLIEGASDGVGLGHEFLRHVERAGLLVHLVEPEPTDQTEPLENYNAIRSELALYDESLGQRDEVLAVTKCELENASEVAEQLRETTGKKVFLISSLTGEGLSELQEEIMVHVQRRRAELLEAGKPLEVQQTEAQPKRKRRLPPHLAGPTAQLSNDLQAKDFDEPNASSAEGQSGSGDSGSGASS
ncbi:GTPase ObgE [Rhodopirellula sp. MGV]|uniref:GTPase ObgE n=1 Tax=Rhodopirellula sp. MGV TaxID=2023130 RepID=UPI000B960253|nr:GTPase ObgE [Rhodopirellula sp. MGV]OYP37628.1 GTPase ObgE [Rhodopirellula sp. MGV]PNY34946.1 GTPase ObgE [Rhodopirellula baltica]